jgi:hypothetical protein
MRPHQTVTGRATHILRLPRVCWLVLAGALLSLSLAAPASLASEGAYAFYLHDLPAPALCPRTAPDPSLDICQARFFEPPFQVLSSQYVLLRIGDFEANHASCEAFSRSTTETFLIDGSAVPFTTIPCRYVAKDPANMPFPAGSWGTDFRYLIAPGMLAPGVHTVTYILTADSTYTITGPPPFCYDPSGTCTIVAGTTFTSTNQLIVS